MPYSSEGIGFNRNCHTSWLAAQKIKGVRVTEKLKILGLYENNIGVWRQGILGVSPWHVKTNIPEMFRDGESTSWSARLPDMVNKKILCKLETGEPKKFEEWKDPTGTLRVLYFRVEDVEDLKRVEDSARWAVDWHHLGKGTELLSQAES